MKALVITAVKKIELVELEDLKPQSEKVLIKVAYAGICGSDIGAWNRGDPAGGGACGHEFSGVVVDPGSSKTLKAGDPVTAMELTPCLTCDICLRGDINVCKKVMADSPGLTAGGGMADYVLVRSDMVRKLPDGVDLLLGAMTEPAAVSMHAVRRAQVKKGSRVLILGAGPIGMFAAAASRALEAEYIVITEINKNRIAFAEKIGYADRLLNAEDSDFIDQLKAGAGEKGFDAVIDCSGSGNTDVLKLLRPRGIFMVVAMHPDLHLSRVPIGMNEYDIQGSFFFLPEDFDSTLQLMASGKLDLRSLATKVAEHSEVQSCFEELASGNSPNMKILFKF
jgi:2-desacetyl-2-hydroxyethyl bacteriochlorophyllide A dehydrogenase